jgi:hypothetical protein
MGMIEFQPTMQRVAQVLQTKQNTQKIRDKEIALALGLEPKYFAVIKRRGKIPYEALALFAREHEISLNWILMSQKPMWLKK